MVVLWWSVAWAQSPYAAEAQSIMGVDLDSIERRVDKHRKAARQAPPAAYDVPAQVMADGTIQAPAPRLPLEPNSNLRTVTVHADRALITRYREIQLAA